MRGGVERDVAHGNVLNNLILAIVLSHAPNSDAQSVVEVTVPDTDVCTVALERYTVISIIYCPVVEADE